MSRIMNGRSVSEYQKDEEDSSKLIIPRLHRNMTGEVKCRVYNDYGAEFSSAAQITVICKLEMCWYLIIRFLIIRNGDLHQHMSSINTDLRLQQFASKH